MTRRSQFGSGSEKNPATTVAQYINNTLVANYYNGSNIGEKIENALIDSRDNYGGRAPVIVVAPGDGGTLTWPDTVSLTFDPTNFGHLTLLFGKSVEIEYTGTRTDPAIHLDTTWADRDQRGVTVLGGRHIGTGSPGSAWLRADDTYRGHYCPDYLVWYENGQGSQTGTGVGLEIRNVDGWSEEVLCGGYGSPVIKADYGIRWYGAAVTGGPGTNSYHGSRIMDFATIKGNRRAVEIDANPQYARIQNNTFRPDADNAEIFYLNPQGGRCDGMTIIGNKWEDAADTETGEVGVRLGPDFDGFYGPVLIANKKGVLDTDLTADGSAQNVYWINQLSRLGGPAWEDWSTGYLVTPFRFGEDSDVAVTRIRGNTFEPFYVDLSTYYDQDFTNPENGTIYFHDGTGTITLADGSTTSAQGAYMYDEDGDGGSGGYVAMAQLS